MRFKRRIKLEHGLEQINMAPLIDVIFLLLIFFMLSNSFTFQAGIHVKLPKAVTSENIQNENFVITISGENVLYVREQVLTIPELTELLQQPSQQDRPILIRADRRASMGRIVDVWDLCRKLGVSRINIATTKNQ